MGTRSAIGYKTPEGKIRAKYSHYDGYPAYTGVMLQTHYQEARKIAQMVELGDQSFLAENIFPKGEHSFEKPEDNCTIFYGRDRGERDVDAHDFETVQEFVDYYKECGCEYFYLHTSTGWIVNHHSDTNSQGWPIFDMLELRVEGLDHA